MLHQYFRRSQLIARRQQIEFVANKLGASLAGDWINSARTIRIGTCALVHDSPQFGLCIANADEMALASNILFGTRSQGPALYDIVNHARQIMTVNARNPNRALRLVHQ
jgi:hypothetical protein